MAGVNHQTEQRAQDGAEPVSLTVGIPTYGRERVLLATLRNVLSVLGEGSTRLIVADQTPAHEAETRRQLEWWEAEGKLTRLALARPSLTAARNAIVKAAATEVVLFLDDDVIIPDHLVEEHRRAYRDPGIAAVTGQVYNCIDYRRAPGLDDPTRGTLPHSNVKQPGEARNISGGNHSVRKRIAETVGYDEHFIGSALGEDLDFARRLIAGGYRIWYNPEAWMIHLGYPSGGCSVSGERSWPEWSHSANLSLYAFRHGWEQHNFFRMMWMAFRNGPGRREVVLRPWRWPGALWGWVRGLRYGHRHRLAVKSA